MGRCVPPRGTGGRARDTARKVPKLASCTHSWEAALSGSKRPGTGQKPERTCHSDRSPSRSGRKPLGGSELQRVADAPLTTLRVGTDLREGLRVQFRSAPLRGVHQPNVPLGPTNTPSRRSVKRTLRLRLGHKPNPLDSAAPINRNAGNADMNRAGKPERFRCAGDVKFKAPGQRITKFKGWGCNTNRAFSSHAAPSVPQPDKGGLNATRLALTQSPQVEQAVRLTGKVMDQIERKLGRCSKQVQSALNRDRCTGVLSEFLRYTERMKANPHTGRIREELFNTFITDPNFLLYAYLHLVDRKVSSGIDGVPSGNMTLPGIVKLANQLKNNTYRPHPVRRVELPKPGGGTRPLGVASTKDKIVQQAVKLVLEPILEPRMHNLSHGFRPKRSCHSALHHIELRWPATTWFIEFDVVKMFDRIQHRVLVNVLRSHFHDPGILTLIKRMLSVGYVNLHGLSDSRLESTMGTPQGSILSPLLANIYLDRFDDWVEGSLMAQYNTEKSSEVNPEYMEKLRDTAEWSSVKQSIRRIVPQASGRSIEKQLGPLKLLKIKHEDVAYYKMDPKYRRLRYIRYADDFLLGFVGPKRDILRIMQLVCYFLEAELHLEVNVEKSGYAHHTKGVLFLGYKLLGNYGANVEIKIDKQRAKHTRIRFAIPVERILRRYCERGMFQWAKKGKAKKVVGRSLDKWQFLPSDVQVINRFNAVARGLANYYSGSEHPYALSEVFHLMKRSAALTLARRHKLKSARQAFKRWGKDLSVESQKPGKKKQQTHFVIPKIQGGHWRSGNLEEAVDFRPSGLGIATTFDLVASADERACVIQGCGQKASHWHHIRHRAHVKGKRQLTNRLGNQLVWSSQIPVCTKHHQLIHAGKYDGPALRSLPDQYTLDSEPTPIAKGK